MSDDVVSLHPVRGADFKLGDFVQDKLTNYVGKLCACTQYLHGQTCWGMLSVKALRGDLGGLGLVTPQNYDWLPEERLDHISSEQAHEVAERMRDLQERKEDGIYRVASMTSQTHSGKIR